MVQNTRLFKEGKLLGYSRREGNKEAVCAGCSIIVQFTDRYLSTWENGTYGFYRCPRCHNFVCARYRSRPVRLSSVLKPAWNKGGIKRANKIQNSLRFLECRTDKDFLILYLMNKLAKEEDHGFNSVMDQKFFTSALLFNKNEYLGYITWNASEKCIEASQVYIFPEKRREGFASALVKFWAENYVPEGECFKIESPNTISVKMLLKLGYLEQKGKSLVFKRCKFTSYG